MDFRVVDFRDNPAPLAGAEFLLNVPAGEIWRIVSVTVFLQASAGAANREVILTFDQNSSTATALVPSGVTQLANEGRVYSFVRGAGYRGAGAQSLHVVTGLGDIYLGRTAGRIRSQTMNLQAADQFGIQRIWAERIFV